MFCESMGVTNGRGAPRAGAGPRALGRRAWARQVGGRASGVMAVRLAGARARRRTGRPVGGAAGRSPPCGLDQKPSVCGAVLRASAAPPVEGQRLSRSPSHVPPAAGSAAVVIFIARAPHAFPSPSEGVEIAEGLCDRRRTNSCTPPAREVQKGATGRGGVGDSVGPWCLRKTCLGSRAVMKAVRAAGRGARCEPGRGPYRASFGPPSAVVGPPRAASN